MSNIPTFQYDLLKCYSIMFGALFANIYINREDDKGNNIDTLKVPLTYAPRDKMLARVTQDPAINRPLAINLPAMSFEYKGLAYDGSRKLPTMNMVLPPNESSSIFTPVPYDINYNLYVYAKNINDANRIIEQILPLFTPDWTAQVNLIPSQNVTRNIVVTLNSCTPDDTYEGDNITRRAIIWTLNFTVKGYFFGPPQIPNIIKFVNIGFFAANNINNIANNAVEEDVNIEVTPGLTANGQPTSNSAQTVNYMTISANNNYGFIESWINDK